MLTISQDAAEAIRNTVSALDMPDSAGVRIAASPVSANGRPGFALEVTEEPHEGDEVVEEEGAQVFLGPAAASALEDKLLEVRPGPSGEGALVIAEQD